MTSFRSWLQVQYQRPWASGAICDCSRSSRLPVMAPADARLDWLAQRSCQLLDVEPALFDPLLNDPASITLLKEFVNGGT